MKNIRYKYLAIALLSLVFSACEDVIDLDLDERPNQLVVDAFITNSNELQTIRLTSSAPYFQNQPTPGVSGVSLRVIGPNNQAYVFQDAGNGNYQYDPATNGALDSLNFTYRMELNYQGEAFIATSKLNPVPKIDSLSSEFEEAELGFDGGYVVQFWATDFFGRKDYYWIRSYKNGENVFANEPATLILSEDAAFGGEGADGFLFIQPIRNAVTNDDDPFVPGDKSTVELLSLNADAYQFLDQVTIQANNGGLFSTPPANIRSNILYSNGSPQEEVLGVFSLSSISIDSLIVTP